MDLDRYGRQILQVLHQEGRISNQELADRIGLLPSPCLRRVCALEETGLIFNVKVAYATHESPLPPRGGGVGGEGNGHDFHDRGCLEKS